MRKSAFAVGVLVALLASLSAQAETVRVYDQGGQYQGRAEVKDGQARLYDAKGKYQGRVASPSPNGGEARLYDPAGGYRGRITQTPPSNAKPGQNGL